MYNQIKMFYADIIKNSETMDPIKLAAWTHAEFVKIHPFIDGNGTTARLIMNYELMKNNYLPISIKEQSRFEYYNALDNYATTGNLTEFEKIIYELEDKRLDEINIIISQTV